MSFLHNYRAPIALHWQGRLDGKGAPRFHDQTHCIDLQKGIDIDKSKTNYAFLGFTCDEGIVRNQGRPGAAKGPEYIRNALAKLPLHKKNKACFYDVGDITCVNENLETSQKALASAVTLLLEKGLRPIIFGGGHEISWGHYQGIAKAHPRIDCGIINFDAHFDLRPLVAHGKGSSGTSFQQIAHARKAQNLPFSYTCIGIQESGNSEALFNKAKRLGAKHVLARDIHLNGTASAISLIDQMIEKHEHLYVTLCLDLFSSAYAPAVSAPQPLGLTPWQVIPLIERLAQSGKVIGFDIAELCPAYDRDGQTAQLAAQLVAAFVENAK